jgi:hypothetical protein
LARLVIRGARSDQLIVDARAPHLSRRIIGAADMAGGIVSPTIVSNRIVGATNVTGRVIRAATPCYS